MRTLQICHEQKKPTTAINNNKKLCTLRTSTIQHQCCDIPIHLWIISWRSLDQF